MRLVALAYRTDRRKIRDPHSYEAPRLSKTHSLALKGGSTSRFLLTQFLNAINIHEYFISIPYRL
jgi:hypothetical protein